MTIEFLRTPEARFDNLPGFRFQPHYVEGLRGLEPLRIHYLDEGTGSTGRIFLCLHGQPTWSYLYRRMIPVFAGAEHRVIVPDLPGFGRSDKPVHEDQHSFIFHRDFLIAFIDAVCPPEMKITLVVQDWGGILGLTLPMEVDRIDQLLVMNTIIPTGVSPGQGFEDWQAFVAAKPDFGIAALMRRACSHLSEAETAAYEAPFPDDRHRAAIRRFPAMMPTDTGMEGALFGQAAADFFKVHWRGKAFVAIGALDPVFGPQLMEKLVILLDCKTPMRLIRAGHFMPEWGEEVASRALLHLG